MSTSEQLFVFAAATLTARGQLPDGNKRSISSGVVEMLWTLFLILFVLWLLGAFVVPVGGSLIHLLLVVAIAVVLIRVIQGRRLA